MDHFVVYGYDNSMRKVPIDKKIVRIDVEVLSGDEIVMVTYEDGSLRTYDGGTRRRMNYFDGSYAVKGPTDIERWIDFKPLESPGLYSGIEAYSYQRMHEFI